MAEGLPSASLFENARFNALVVVPNAVQGIFRKRRAAVAVATRANVDGHAIGLLEGIERSYGGSPVWVRLVTDPALLLIDPDDIARALDGSPESFASDPPAKRDGMVHFQPSALTISRGQAWRSRRRFTDAVLAEAHPGAGMGERIEAVCGEELDRLLEGPVAMAGGVLGWDHFHGVVQRIARRLILGDAAADDDALTEMLGEMMSAANSMPGEPSEELDSLTGRLAAYAEAAEPGSLVERFAAAPADDLTAAVGQLPHWLFAFGDTLAINAMRALAVLAGDAAAREAALDDERYLEGCLREAMRLWPTTAMLSRELLDEVEWNGETVPIGTQVVIVNTFEHRNRNRFDFADRFEPGIWIDGEAVGCRAFNHFSSGPQGCPGESLAVGVGALLLEGCIERGLESVSPRLDPAKRMPQMLDFYAIRVRVGSD